MNSHNDFAMGIFGMLNPAWAERMRREEEEHERRVWADMMKRKQIQPWDEDRTKCEKRLLLDAKTWNPTILFDVPPLTGLPGERMKKMEQRQSLVVSPNGRWAYANHVLPKGHWLTIAQNKRRGQVAFTDDVVHPVLAEYTGKSDMTVWMGFTPMETMSQRGGIMKATGRVVVGGLGLGWFLHKVCSKPSVTEVVIVDREKVLLDWLGPVLREKYPSLVKVTGWVCSDVYEYMEKDAANHTRTRYLLDIWPSFGCTDSTFDAWKKRLGPKQVWGWGDVEY